MENKVAIVCNIATILLFSLSAYSQIKMCIKRFQIWGVFWQFSVQWQQQKLPKLCFVVVKVSCSKQQEF